MRLKHPVRPTRPTRSARPARRSMPAALALLLLLPLLGGCAGDRSSGAARGRDAETVAAFLGRALPRGT
ncbi:hypothetical protein DY218_29380, partial [Streptomyces triticagri]